MGRVAGRGGQWFGVAVVLVSAPPELAAAQEVINVSERAPLALLVSPAKGTESDLSALILAMSQVLEARTDFSVRVHDPRPTVDDCAGKLTCITRAVRPDYRRGALILGNGQLQEYSEHVRRLPPRSYARYFVYAVVLPGADASRRPGSVAVMLIDTDDVLSAWHTASRADPDWASKVESEVKRRSKVAVGRLGAELQLSVEALVTQKLGPEFARTGHWDPYGAITLVSTVEGLGVLVDDEEVGKTSVGSTTLVSVIAGRRTIAVAHPDYEPWQVQVEVPRGASVEVRTEPQRLANAGAARSVVLWSGLGLAAAGLALTGYAIAQSAGESGPLCATLPGESTDACDGGGFTQLGSSGVLTAPAGYSLIAVGGSFALGASVFGGDDEIPWIAVAVGVALGAVSYGLSAALDP